MTTFFKEKTMNRLLTMLAVVMLSLVLVVSGCEALQRAAKQSQDPNTAPKVEAAETAAEGAVGILQALGVLWPGAAVGGAGLAAALRAWRNAKKNLATSNTESEAYFHTTEALVTAIEDYREKNPEKWKKLKASLEDAVGPNAEAIIRAIRGMPMKS
jgi:hypothetical protein